MEPRRRLMERALEKACAMDEKYQETGVLYFKVQRDQNLKIAETAERQLLKFQAEAMGR